VEVETSGVQVLGAVHVAGILVPTMITMIMVNEEVDHMVGHLEIIIQDEAAAAAVVVVVVDMDFDDRMMEMFKFLPTQYSFKIYQKMLHVKKLSMLFQLLVPLKRMIDQVVPKFGFTKIVILVKAMVEQQLPTKMMKLRIEQLRNIMISTSIQ